MRIEEARSEVLAAFVARAAADGWSERCLRAAAAGVGADLAAVAFPGGLKDLTRHFIEGADARAAAALAAHDLEAMRVRERIAAAVRLRLVEHAEHKPALRALVTALATPRLAALGARALWGTASGLWYAVGDRATDFSFYSKRALLGGVYAATLLYWLDDESADSAAAWRFLDDRIAEAMGIQRLRGRLDSVLARRPLAGRAHPHAPSRA
jgi:ubiquinone biosynthesis protein COQ9